MYRSRKYLFVAILATQTLIGRGQEQPYRRDYAAEDIKHTLSVDLGTHYNFQFGSRYTPPHHTIGNPSYSSGPSGGLRIHFCWSKQLGVLYEYKFSNKFRITGAAYYFRRKHLTTSDPDSVIKYVQSTGYENPPIKSNLSANNIELSILVGYIYKRFSVFIGTKVTLFSKIHIRETLLNGDEIERYSKYGQGDIDHIVYPTLRMDYQIIRLSEKLPISMYLAADMRSFNHYDFQFGAVLVFLKK